MHAVIFKVLLNINYNVTLYNTVFQFGINVPKDKCILKKPYLYN